MLQEQIKKIAERVENPSRYKNASVFITGATGFIGSMLAKTFLFLNKQYNLNIKIIFYVRNKEKLLRLYEESLEKIEYDIVLGNLNESIEYGDKIDYIFHLANSTNSKEMIQKPVEVLSEIFEGTKYILELAREKNVKDFTYISSMEVYGQINSENRTREEELGYIDILNVRSSYSEGKRVAECLCKSYFHEYGLPLKIARLSQIFGAGISKEDNRVFAQFIKKAMAQEDIILHSLGEGIGNYCSVIDAIVALFCIVEKGASGEVYNVVNEENTMTIREMAELVAREIGEDKISVRVEIPKENLGYAPPTNLKLSGEKLEALGWKAEHSLKQMYWELYQYLSDK